MKVCLLNDSFPPVIDGVANTVMNYARVLQTELDSEALVATPAYPNADYHGYPYQVVAYKSLNTAKLSAGYRAGDPFDTEAIEKMLSFRPEIIHSHCPFVSTIMARVLRNEIHVPLVFTYHTKFDVDIKRAVKSKAIEKESIKFIIANITACDEVWTVSEGAGHNLRSLGYEGSWRVMNNGVDFAKGKVSQSEINAAVKGYDLPDLVPMYLFVGRMMTYKGLPLIIEAMKQLSDAGHDFRMVLIGAGEDRSAMIEKAKHLGLSVDVKKDDGTIDHFEGTGKGKLIFVGAINDRNILRAWNTRADLFLFPSTYDTNGIVVREAAAVGLASVLIKGSCAAEGITDGRNGYFIDESAQAMAELLKTLDQDLSRVHETGQRAMDEIYLSWDDAVKTAYLRYQELIELKERGMLAVKRKTSLDYLYDTAASISRTSERLSEMTDTLFAGLLGNYYNGNLQKEQQSMLQKEFEKYRTEAGLFANKKML